MPTNQIHDKFKIFTGSLAANNSLGALADEVAAFVKGKKVAAKSIGVEYLEASKKVVLSLGYREGEGSFPIKITTASLGKVGGLESGDTSRLEAAMGAASGKISGIICHELYITADGDFLAVFMSHVG